MGPRRAGDPPQYSSTPPRPPDPNNLRMKLQIEIEETAAGFRELQKSMASMATEQALFQSEILNELRQLRLGRTAKVIEPLVLQIDSQSVTQPISSVLQFESMDSYRPQQQHYMRPPPPHANHLLPPLGSYPPPTHVDHLPPPLGSFSPSLPNPCYAHHYHPQSLPHGPPQSYHPQQLNWEWGAQKSGTGLAEMGLEINSFRSPGSSLIMTAGFVQVQAIGCLSTMDESEIKGIEASIGVSLETGFDQIRCDVELQSEYDKVFVAELGNVEHKVDVASVDEVDFQEREEKELEVEDGEADDENKDDERENDSMIFGNFLAANQFLEELERESGAVSYSGAESYGDRSLSYGDKSQIVDGQIVSGSDKEVNTNEQGGVKESFDSVALAALLKVATSAAVLDGNKLENQVAPLVPYVIPHMHANFVNPNFQPISSVLINYALPKCCRYGKDIGICYVVNVFNALYVRLKHYIEGSKKISHHVLQLCLSGYDKKVRDKGSTLLTDELSMEYFARTMASVISLRNGCFDFHHDHGCISSGMEFNSFVMSKTDGCIVVLYWNMDEEDDMEEIELTPEVCDLFNGDWVFDPVTHPLYKEDECEFLTAQMTCMRNGRRNSLYQHWRWQPRDCNLPKFNARLLLEKLRNKRLVFVGDSLNRNQRESIICFAQSVIPPGRKSLVKNGSLSVFRIEDYNTTVKYKWETKGSGNLLMLAHPLHVKLLMNDIEVVHKGIKPFSLKDLGIFLDDGNGNFYLVFVKTDKSTPYMELVFKKEKSYMAIGYDITDEKANVNIVKVHVKAFDEKWMAEITTKIVMVMTNARLYITTHTKVIIGVCKTMQLSKYEIRNSGDLFTDELARHFPHIKSASNPLRHCSSSAISIVDTLLLYVALVMYVTALGVMMTIEKAQNDEFGEKAKKKQLDIVLGLDEKKLFFIILLQYGISKVGGEFIDDMFCMQFLLDLVRKMLQTCTWENAEPLHSQMTVSSFLYSYMVIIIVDDALELSSRDKELVMENSTHECLTLARVHFDLDVSGYWFITYSKLVLHVQLYSKLLGLRCLPAEFQETRGFQKEQCVVIKWPRALSSFKEDRVLPIQDLIVFGVEATIGNTFWGREEKGVSSIRIIHMWIAVTFKKTMHDGYEIQKFWFVILALCWSSRIFLKLEVKFQLKRGGVVKTQFCDYQAQVCIEAQNSSFGCESPY